jgi:hypothetical protein
MRRDYLIAILLAVSALPLGAALMVAPEYLHHPGEFVPLTFWGGIALALALIFTAATIAWRGEKRPRDETAVSPRSHAPRNVSLADAIWRIRLGRWDDRIDFSDDPKASEAFFKITAEIRQLTLDGKLPVWGSKGVGQPFEPVPVAFWKTHEIVAAYSKNHLVQDVFICVTEPTKIGQTRYARTMDWAPNFMTSREVIEELWPKDSALNSP